RHGHTRRGHRPPLRPPDLDDRRSDHLGGIPLMDQLFGISMDAIMVALVALCAVSVASVGLIFFTNRVMFRMGVRNLYRRGLQSGLVIVGLMLATLISTAAFVTGDTVDHSITRAGYEQLQRSDLQVNFVGSPSALTGDSAV